MKGYSNFNDRNRGRGNGSRGDGSRGDRDRSYRDRSYISDRGDRRSRDRGRDDRRSKGDNGSFGTNIGSRVTRSRSRSRSRSKGINQLSEPSNKKRSRSPHVRSSESYTKKAREDPFVSSRDWDLTRQQLKSNDDKPLGLKELAKQLETEEKREPSPKLGNSVKMSREPSSSTRKMPIEASSSSTRKNSKSPLSLKLMDNSEDPKKNPDQELCCDYASVDEHCPLITKGRALQQREIQKREYDDKNHEFSERRSNITISISGHGMKHVPLFVDSKCNKPILLLDTIHSLYEKGSLEFGNMNDNEMPGKHFQFMFSPKKSTPIGGPSRGWCLYISPEPYASVKINEGKIHSFLFGYNWSKHENKLQIWTIYPIKDVEERDNGDIVATKYYGIPLIENTTPKTRLLSGVDVIHKGKKQNSPLSMISASDAIVRSKTFKELKVNGIPIDELVIPRMFRYNSLAEISYDLSPQWLNHPLVIEHNDITYFVYPQKTSETLVKENDSSIKQDFINFYGVKVREYNSAEYVYVLPDWVTPPKKAEFERFVNLFTSTKTFTEDEKNYIKDMIDENAAVSFPIPTSSKLDANPYTEAELGALRKSIFGLLGKTGGNRTRKYK